VDIASYADKGEYAQDIDKIVYSNAYKRLALKSQIIIKPTKDHFRSRLIHTEEVNQIALSLGRKLKLNLDLITAIAKAHDLGHTPFGHAGERTIQIILERELLTRFGLKSPKSEREREALRKNIFHHSLNSARMLIKEKEFENIHTQIIEGVLTHSWSPWKQENTLVVPPSYEAQVVAIADQIASINHDTEDIIAGAPYTEYDRDRFLGGIVNGFKNKYPDSFNMLQNEVTHLIVDKSIESGYGRNTRVNTFITKIAVSTLEMMGANKISEKAQAQKFPLCLPKEWADFLRFYETFIRDLVQEKISWFIARDNMAGALISTVFNHLWPRARASATISQMTLPIFPKEELVKAHYKEKTEYIDHFVDFFNDHYFNEKEHINFYEQYLRKQDPTKGIKTWDTNILASLINEKVEISPETKTILTRLIAVIDFISGLTDRYCLEMFNEVYQEFTIT
jgi:dGTP triphosphohydrolase